MLLLPASYVDSCLIIRRWFQPRTQRLCGSEVIVNNSPLFYRLEYVKPLYNAVNCLTAKLSSCAQISFNLWCWEMFVSLIILNKNVNILWTKSYFLKFGFCPEYIVCVIYFLDIRSQLLFSEEKCCKGNSVDKLYILIITTFP